MAQAPDARDAESPDARAPDDSSSDAQDPDARVHDARVHDARVHDARVHDARAPDDSSSDAQDPDARVPDADARDAESPDDSSSDAPFAEPWIVAHVPDPHVRDPHVPEVLVHGPRHVVPPDGRSDGRQPDAVTESMSSDGLAVGGRPTAGAGVAGVKAADARAPDRVPAGAASSGRSAEVAGVQPADAWGTDRVPAGAASSGRSAGGQRGDAAAARERGRLAPRLRHVWSRGNGNGQGGRDSAYAPEKTGVATGRARVDRRTKNLIPRLAPGEVAVIDHVDLDRVAAEGLIRAQAAAVINASRSISGRYPNLGPLLLAAAGIPLVDEVGREVMDRIHEGDVVRVVDGDVVRDGEVVAHGTRHSLESLEAQIEVAKQSIDTELQAFAENTLEYLRQERHLLTETPVLPDLEVDIAGRHVLVVVRGGSDSRADLSALRAYIREIRPVIIAVDGGADAVLEAGHRPDIIIGDFDSVSTEALRGDAELVVHAFRGGDAPGAARLVALGMPYATFEAAGTSEDVAMLLAYEKRAELIVAVGTHASMVEFFDKGRAGMASTFLVRLKVGPILVDAKGVSRLYQSRVRTRDLAFLVAAALFAMLMMVAVAQPLHVFVKALWFSLEETWRTLL